MNRRRFIGTAGILTAASVIQQPWLDYAGNCTDITTLYDRSIVIDALATPGGFNIPWPPAGPLLPEQVQSVRDCGMTAVNVTVSHPSFETTVRQIALWQSNINDHQDLLTQVRRVEDIDRAKRDGKLGLILGFQDTEMIGRDLSLLDTFFQFGIRIIQLTYNKRNFVGDGCLEARDGGLSNFGKEAVDTLNASGIAVDVSHCGPRTTLDAIELSNRPLLITHSGCKAVYNNPRNKDDEALKAMADRGGVIGIYLMPFLGNDGSPYANQEMFFQHIVHALNVCGTDHVGIGSDLSITPIEETAEYLDAWEKGGVFRAKRGVQAPDEAGRFPYLPEINTPRRLEHIAMGLSKRGYSCDAIEKVLGANFRRVLEEIW